MKKNVNRHLTAIVRDMVKSYEDNSVFPTCSTVELPRKDAIISIINDIRKLLFPAYFGTRQLTDDSVEYYVGDLLLTIEEKICSQMQLAWRYQRQKNGESEEGTEKPCESCIAFLKTLPRIQRLVSLDVQAAFDGDPAAADVDQIVFSYPGIFAISVYRIAHELYELGVPLIPRIMSEYAHGETGIEIHPGAKIGEYFFIDHGTGIVIGETVIIGDHVKIYQGVTLGALSTRGGQSLRGKKRHPTIEDNVTIYSGASVLGGDTVIGENAVIGGNAFITESVPKDTSVSMKKPELRFKTASNWRTHKSDHA